MRRHSSSYAGDAPAHAGKDKLAQHDRLPLLRGARPHFCRHCGTTQTSEHVPAGWYALGRHRGAMERTQRLGLYCSIACLTAMLPRLGGIDVALGEDWTKVVGIAPFGETTP